MPTNRADRVLYCSAEATRRFGTDAASSIAPRWSTVGPAVTVDDGGGPISLVVTEPLLEQFPSNPLHVSLMKARRLISVRRRGRRRELECELGRRAHQGVEFPGARRCRRRRLAPGRAVGTCG